MGYPQDPQALLGRTVRGYELRELLHEGARHYLYAGEQTALRRAVAIRLLKPFLAGLPEVLDPFLAAGKNVARLLHPAIVPIYNIVSEGDLHFIVSEYVNQRPLSRWLDEGGAVAPGLLLKLGEEIMHCLAYVHGEALVHGNLAPANVFLDVGGRVRLNDFEHPPDISAWDETRIWCVAPEQIAGAEPDARADVFSAGAVLYRVATGEPPYSAEEYAFLKGGGQLARAELAHQRRPVVSEAVSMALAHLVSPRPEQRPATMIDAMELWRDAGSGKVQVSAPAATEPAPKKERFVKALPEAVVANPQKRCYKRLPSDINAVIKSNLLTESAARSMESRLGNISENGAYVPCPEPLPIGSFVTLEFDLGRRGVRIHAVGVVRWVEETPTTSGMGVQFVKVTTKDQERLREYIDQQTKQQMAHDLVATDNHRKVLREVLANFGGTLQVQALVKKTGASRQLARRVLEDFQRHGLIRIRGEEIECVPPATQAMRDYLKSLLVHG